MKKFDMLDLLFKAKSEDSVVEFMDFIGADPKKVKLGKYDSETGIDGEKMEVTLEFATFEHIMDGLKKPDIEITPLLATKLDYMSTFPEGVLFLSSIAVFEESMPSLSASMPYQLNADMKKERILEMLGRPATENANVGSAQWFYDTNRLVLNFDDTLKITVLAVDIINNSRFRI